MQCLSCKNRSTNERCQKYALKNCLFCGIHMKSKYIRHWVVANKSIQTGLIKLQALWKGYAIRYRLKLAGPGVLKRSLCHNDEEMVTCESKNEVSPLDYFSVVESDGKIWWFDQRSMIEWSRSSPEIRNPFTRSELSNSDASRLRNLAYIRKKKGNAVTHSPSTLTSLEDVRDERWMRVVQIFKECGYGGLIHHENFVSMRYYDIKCLLDTLITDVSVWMYETVGRKDPYILISKRAKYYTWIKAIRATMHSYSTIPHLSRDVATLLIACLNDIRDPEDLSFFILTAYTKASVAAGL